MDTGNDSPPARSTILGSLLRGRPRNISQSPNTTTTNDRELSPSPVPPSPSAATFAAVAALTGGTGVLITNNPITNSSGRRHGHRTTNPNTNTPNSPTSANHPGNINTNVNSLTSPSSPSLPVTTSSSTTSAFANMLRRKPNQNNNNQNNAQQQSNNVQANPGPLSTSAPNPVYTPQIPVSAPSANAPSVPMPGGLPFHPPLTIAASSTHPPNQGGSTVRIGHHPPSGANQTFRIRLVPHLDSRRSLRFDAITRELKDGDAALRIGRFTDRSGMGLSAVNALGSNKLAFKSKVVSRAHAEIWVEKAGKFFIKDTKSSSGTFLNHMRLSPANQESRPHQLKDGDILQLGVDYQGGAEDIYKSVKIRVEVGREWQAGANAFNTAALKNLKNLAAVVAPAVGASANGKTAPTVTAAKPTKLQIPDCCICLFAVTIRQALFIAPCSHTFHYKCIRPLIEAHHPAFSCPLCRTYADLDEDVEVETADAGEAEEPADADTPVRESLDDGEANEQPNGAGNADGIHRQQREDAEMSDASTAPPPVVPHTPAHPPSNASNAFNPFSTLGASHPHPHVHGSSSHANSSRLLPISERDTDRDREAGGETEVEPDSMSPGLSLFGRRTGRRAREERERQASGANFNPGAALHVQMDDEMDDGIIIQAEEGEEPSEAEEIEMVDAIE
ncbi:hypothetical protein M378DRAFT_923051 [Amanita muscaria Koide BX008]|uniref:SMAD/FHA domain-containing protein n=1 Tax=Amanita muscaria (strain Koide BX008) TaxID=946122 RepID=A0A0C2SBW0_AMAMK|nr:hypothetical protein M378DRAFT_923051 [Amanita muscaria Koide BX008]